MPAYYNEIEPYAAQWLRNLIAAGHVAAGDVDERSIVDVRADDLRGYSQCHFFAGIGGWSLALRLAGWPDDRPVWTGSCPCQPFSAAGKGKAADDERHLWPAWFSLIAECRPATIFGEQVEAAIGWGWLDLVCSDLESQGYAIGAAVLPACGVGAPHIRQRLWFVANADERGCERSGLHLSEWRSQPPVPDIGGASLCELAHTHGRNASAARLQRSGQQRFESQDGRVVQLDDTARGRNIGSHVPTGVFQQPIGGSAAGHGLGDADNARLEGRRIDLGEHAGQRTARQTSPWDDCDWLPCTDGKARPVEPGTFPLAHGIPGRVGRLRAYGNAIVPQVAAEFIAATQHGQ